ncbi:stage VI sporulation protein D [Sediminibacillus massiliensis]|uniref:stage VI sporulation protein D n=1 Tax=Sediminibacillus massiliensis TaxID=1926277 RepID=UPI0015C3AC54|nr:stage VI sporulation protein D [Sediminibacillus massiliensis]
MADEGLSVFTFDLNESVWFQRGQEVAEIMGISLEPEISIEEFEDFVSIRGVIELKGEYFQVGEQDSSSSDVLPLGEHPSQRWVDRVETYEDGVNEFFHTFPVEISIPMYRIEAVDELMVGIDSFDYELPEDCQLKLNATLAIHGVKEQRNEVLPVENREEESSIEETEEREHPVTDDESPSERQPEYETFSFDVKEKLEEENSVPETEHDLEEQEDKDRWKYKKTQTLAEFFGKTEETADQLEELKESDEIKSEQIKVESEYDESLDESKDIMESSRQEDPDTRYLLNIFEEKEEQFARMKVCIVQDSDTLDSLAQKYNVSPLNISKRNQLEDEELSEGQILYIPVK